MPEETARQLLRNIQYATIATANQAGEPWNTSVFYAYDAVGNLYWSSHPDSVHSQNIHATGRAFIVIYDSAAAIGQGDGLYIQASVEELRDPRDIQAGLELLAARKHKHIPRPEKFQGQGPQRLYKATALKCWMNSADKDADGDFIRDYRVEVRPFDA